MCLGIVAVAFMKLANNNLQKNIILNFKNLIFCHNSTMTLTVGIIGLGQAGRKICCNLASHGHNVLIFDLNTDLYKGLPVEF